MEAIFYVIAYAVGLTVLCGFVLAYAYFMSVMFAKAASTPSEVDHRGTRR